VQVGRRGEVEAWSWQDRVLSEVRSARYDIAIGVEYTHQRTNGGPGGTSDTDGLGTIHGDVEN